MTNTTLNKDTKYQGVMMSATDYTKYSMPSDRGIYTRRVLVEKTTDDFIVEIIPYDSIRIATEEGRNLNIEQ